VPTDKTAVERLFGEFIVNSGGQIVSSSLFDQSSLPPNADYYFRNSEIIGELKCLQIDSFGLNYQIKLQQLFDQWSRRRLLVVYGRTQVDIRGVPFECQREWMKLIEAPLQTNVLAKADRQIKQTKVLLEAPDSKGILFLTSDGNISLQPHSVLFFFDRLLKKKKEDGSRQYSNIDAVVYFSCSFPGYHPKVSLPIQFWTGFQRDPADQRVREFIDHLESLWFEFQRSVMGRRIRRIEEIFFLKISRSPDSGLFHVVAARISFYGYSRASRFANQV
jgi:hypothetical protein